MLGTQNEKTAVTVECAYAADYTIIRDGFVPSSEQAKAFREGNAIFNLWPYFREYLQSSLLKMGLPALTAPFLCLRPKAPQGGASPQSKGSAGGKSLPKTGKR